MIEFINVTKIYNNNTRALDDITFQAFDSDITGVIGHNGSGKTTMFMLANGLANATSGEIIVDKYNMKSNRTKIQSLTGLFSDTMRLYPMLTVRECLMFFIEANSLPKTRYDYLCSMFKLENFQNKKIGILSTGMMKKVMLAVSIVNKPHILFLDEPFSGLDPEAKHDFIFLIKQLKSEENMHIIISTHELMELESLIRYLIVLKNGKVIIAESMRNLLDVYYQPQSVIIQVLHDNIETFNKYMTLNLNNELKIVRQNIISKKLCEYEVEMSHFSYFVTLLGEGDKIHSILDNKPTLDNLYFKIHSSL